jgi:hypothetical protein
MRYLALVLLLSGCASNPLLSYKPLCPGTRHYDPQICRGETWQQLPNFTNEALIRAARGEKW